ncbi:MAG: ATP-dependent Clp protease proteolytic subunit, partial [Cytophagales bacterium]
MKKHLVLILISLFNLLNAQDSTKVKVIQIFDIKAEIDPRMTRQVKLGFEEAEKNKADLVIIDMNTYGGMVDDADKIRSMVLNFKKPVFVFINNNAASAGALISIACDSIYMTQGANIGAATVVNGSDGQAMPDKYQSYMRSMMRSTAEANKRNPKIAEAMVDPSIEIPGVIEEGKVLTFTTSEAIKNGFCEGEYLTIDELIEKKGLKSAVVKRYEQSSTEKIIAFFLNPAISSILILAIIGGIYFELQTPGIGFALLVAIVAGVLYLVPYYLNGLAQNWEIIILFLGILLIAAEIFVIPGFGVAGILGGIMVALSLALVMLNNDWFD